MNSVTLFVIDRHSHLFEQLTRNHSLPFMCHHVAELDQALSPSFVDQPDVVLTNADFPPLSHLEMIRQLRQRFSKANVLIYSQTIHSDDDLRAMLMLGIAGYVLEHEMFSSFSSILNSLLTGHHVFSLSVSRVLFTSSPGTYHS